MPTSFEEVFLSKKTHRKNFDTNIRSLFTSEPHFPKNVSISIQVSQKSIHIEFKINKKCKILKYIFCNIHSEYLCYIKNKQIKAEKFGRTISHSKITNVYSVHTIILFLSLRSLSIIDRNTPHPRWPNFTAFY